MSDICSEQIDTFEIGFKTCQEKNQREVREQRELRETSSNLQKPTKTILGLDFTELPREKAPLILRSHEHCPRVSGQACEGKTRKTQK